MTVDLDCLRAEEAVTNWESGRFTVEDVRLGDRLCLTRKAGSSAAIFAGRGRRLVYRATKTAFRLGNGSSEN